MPTKAAVAKVLRGARDLMNTNGRHWLKGDMYAHINEDFIEEFRSGQYDGLTISPKAQPGDTAWCAWGGLREVADDLELQVEAMEALVQIISPNGWESYLNYEEEMEYEYKHGYGDYTTFAEYWQAHLPNREEILGEQIATWNDDDQRTWEDVRASLTKAAAKVKSRNLVTT